MRFSAQLIRRCLELVALDLGAAKHVEEPKLQTISSIRQGSHLADDEIVHAEKSEVGKIHR